MQRFVKESKDRFIKLKIGKKKSYKITKAVKLFFPSQEKMFQIITVCEIAIHLQTLILPRLGCCV